MSGEEQRTTTAVAIERGQPFPPILPASFKSKTDLGIHPDPPSIRRLACTVLLLYSSVPLPCGPRSHPSATAFLTRKRESLPCPPVLLCVVPPPSLPRPPTDGRRPTANPLLRLRRCLSQPAIGVEDPASAPLANPRHSSPAPDPIQPRIPRSLPRDQIRIRLAVMDPDENPTPPPPYQEAEAAVPVNEQPPPPVEEEQAEAARQESAAPVEQDAAAAEGGGGDRAAGGERSREELERVVMELGFQNDYLKSQIAAAEGGSGAAESELVKGLKEQVERLRKEVEEHKQTQKATEAALEHVNVAYAEADAKVQDLTAKLTQG